jgi:hypothetical protein
MKIAFLLLVHDQPLLSAQLIRAIDSSDSSIFIHVDARCNQETFQAALSTTSIKSKITFIKNRVICYWGRYSLVQATLTMLREALHQDSSIEHFILLSGHDFPVKPIESLQAFLERHNDIDFIEYYKLPSKRLNEKEDGIYRINRYHYYINGGHKEFPPFSKKPLLNPLFNGLSKAFQLTFRKIPLGMKIYAGSQWWMLSRKTIEKLLTLLQTNPSIEKFFENVWIPDEIFFQSLVLHLKQDEHNLVNNNFRAIKWLKADKSTIRFPKVLTVADFNDLIQSEAFFARKFDEVQSAELIHLINNHKLG